jgi:hypothetical protein
VMKRGLSIDPSVWPTGTRAAMRDGERSRGWPVRSRTEACVGVISARP